jgi:hypothetical protein
VEQNNHQYEYLGQLLANPADVNDEYAANLHHLVAEHPQSGLLRVLLARTGKKDKVRTAVVYLNNKLVYSIVKHPLSLTAPLPSQIIIQSAPLVSAPIKNKWSHDEETVPEYQSNTLTSLLEAQKDAFDKEVFGFEAPIASEVASGHEQAEDIAIQNDIEERVEGEWSVPVNVEEEDDFENLHQDEAQHNPQFEEEYDGVRPSSETSEGVANENPEVAVSSSGDIEDEVFDEIVGIEHIEITAVTPADIEESPPSSATANSHEHTININDETERLIVGNIAATNYFVFEQAFAERKKNDAPAGPEVPAEKQVVEDNQVSKYNDDKLPYTFLWWLDKTRREHAGVYQPYVNTNTPSFRPQTAKKEAPDALHQQYVENIFHLTSVEELSRSTVQQEPETEVKRKEDHIIEKFIQEEPQIKPPSSEKLDTENKARRSAEDADEIVTETLARIYNDQMLYHKAIATYKKLKLNFPEKSRYFDGQIETLERKIN